MSVWMMHRTGLGSCLMSDFGISGFETSGSVTRDLVRWLKMSGCRVGLYTGCFQL